jgi:hypothetical protein
VIGNCHAGPHNPILIEIEPATKKVVWQFKQYEAFGNNVQTRNSSTFPGQSGNRKSEEVATF